MKQKGFSPIAIVILLALLALGVAVFFFVKSGLSLPGITTRPQTSQPDQMSEEVSDSTDSDTLESEIDQTQLDSLESDFSELDSSASQL
jgi:hypothetical protein